MGCRHYCRRPCTASILIRMVEYRGYVGSLFPYRSNSVGLVNEDKGAVVRDKHIDAGKELVDELKGNKDLDWHFTDRKQAMKSLRDGDYFAVIIVPENFSKQLGTVISDHPKKAKIEYYVNEKINSISPKITQRERP